MMGEARVYHSATGFNGYPIAWYWDQPGSLGIHGPFWSEEDANESVRIVGRSTSDMEANRAALPKPPAYARDLMHATTTAWAQREAEVLEELIVTWKAENPGIEGEIVFHAGQRPTVRAKAITPMTLFAQLREMGVRCETCKNASHSGYVYSFCGETDWLGEDFLCGKWEGK